jgi:hypothetical protein
MDDLLKEAIADAKAVRETALENAKVALEEAFTPRLKSMLSKKIQSEIEDEGTEEEVTEQDEEEDEEDEEVQDEGVYEDDEDPSDEFSDEEAGEEEEAPEEEMPEEGMEEDGVIEINGVMYAPVVSEDEEEAPEDEEEEADMGEDEDLDLEAVLRELEAELQEDEDEEEDEVSDETESMDEADDEDDDEKEDVDEEVDKSSGIGKSDNHKGESDESSKIGVPGKAKHESVEITEGDDDDPDDDEVEEEIDLEEVLRALQEEDEEDTTSEDMENLQTELDEHRDVVKYLRSKLNEVNLLNAKLLFTNKLFRSYGLSNDQKMKVVETFDRAQNLREVKLVYATMAESFGTRSTREEIVKESKKGSASKPVASTKSEKQEQEIITESDVMKARFKKLANIL